MTRLTEPSINPYTNKVGGYIQNNKEIKHINFFGDGRDLDILKVFDKLGELEDIEEELGLNLFTYFNLMRNGGYFKMDGKIKFGYPFYQRDVESYVLGTDYESIVIPKEENQGKDWALTKEELKGE